MTSSKKIYHLLAIGTSILWGTTFVSTKILLANSLSPADIMFYRFVIAYILMVALWPFIHKKSDTHCQLPWYKRYFRRYGFQFQWNWKDECRLLALGLTGGSIYFLTENTALEYTFASNVSLLISTAPLFTALLHLPGKHIKFTSIYWTGSIVALIGIALVVYNGHFILKLNPIGDILTICAALSWAIYTLLLKPLECTYSSQQITRRVFFYGALTLIPYFIFRPLAPIHLLWSSPDVLLNILFLSIICSYVCYLAWNSAIRHVGPVKISNYIYINPVVTCICAAIVLHENITWFALGGAVLVLSGVFMVSKYGQS
jgi:drug/metabolite transporter (DMT)-like permease